MSESGELFESMSVDVSHLLDWVELRRSTHVELREFENDFGDHVSQFKFSEEQFPEELKASIRSYVDTLDESSHRAMILSQLCLSGLVFSSASEREKHISQIALALFQSLGMELCSAKTTKERAKIIHRLIFYSSPTEMLLSFLNIFSMKDKDVAKQIVTCLIGTVQQKCPVKYSRKLNQKELFEVSTPFLRSVIFSEQMQLLIVFADAVYKYLIQRDPELWLEIGPLFRQSLDIRGEEMNLSLLSKNDQLHSVRTSESDYLLGHEDILLDRSLALRSVPAVMFRRYQERVSERVSKQYLSFFAEYYADLPRVRDASLFAQMTRYIQDYLVGEFAHLNTNCLMSSELMKRPFVELLVVTLDMIRERLVLLVGQGIELETYDNLAYVVLLPSILKNENLVEALDSLETEINAKQTSLLEKLLKVSLVENSKQNLFIAKSACCSPYRFISSLNWIFWKDIKGDIEFDQSLIKDSLFAPSVMLSWVLYKEQQST